jgi:octaprenyl-diphosphate synthase
LVVELLRELITDDMLAVDEVIRRRLESQVPLIGQIADYIIGSGGKRLRPALLLMAAGAVGYRSSARFELAAIIEFIHTATLLHDDVVDSSERRRGRKTANAVFGNAAAVLVGDFVYSRAFQMMVGVDHMRVMAILADATNVISEGEVLQLANAGNAALSEDDYLRVVRFKTAKLFEAAARLPAVLAGVPHEIECALAAYGQHLGTAFQLVDDVLDYSGGTEEIGKNLGDDLAEGKATLPLIYVMRQGAAADADFVRRSLREGGRDNFDRVHEAIKRSGALEYAREVAGRESDAAQRAIERVVDSAYRMRLLELASFAVSRSF